MYINWGWDANCNGYFKNEVFETNKAIEYDNINSNFNIVDYTPFKRDVIDDSYHIALTVNFKSIEDHDVYQEDPVHLHFIAEHKDKWEKVQVYDFETD